MSDYLYNIYDEEVEVLEFSTGVIAKFEDGTIKIFDSYKKAMKVLFKMGYHF